MHKQIIVCIEELSELQKELCKLLRDEKGSANFEKVVEEIADVLIMIEQVKMMLDIDDDRLQEMVNYKIGRTLYRMENRQIRMEPPFHQDIKEENDELQTD